MVLNVFISLPHAHRRSLDYCSSLLSDPWPPNLPLPPPHCSQSVVLLKWNETHSHSCLKPSVVLTDLQRKFQPSSPRAQFPALSGLFSCSVFLVFLPVHLIPGHREFVLIPSNSFIQIIFSSPLIAHPHGVPSLGTGVHTRTP